MSMDKWEALLEQWENITLTPDTLMAPAFDDNPDQSDVPLPIIRVAGVKGWGFIDVPKELQGLAQFVEVLEEVVRLRKGMTRLQKAFHYQAAPHDDHMYAQGWDYAVDLMESEITDILEGKSTPNGNP